MTLFKRWFICSGCEHVIKINKDNKDNITEIKLRIQYKDRDYILCPDCGLIFYNNLHKAWEGMLK